MQRACARKWQELTKDSPPVVFSDWRLLLWTTAVLLLSMLGWMTLRFHWPIFLALVPFSAGWVTSPTLSYVAIRSLSEGRVTFPVFLASLASLLSFALWLATLYLAAHPAPQHGLAPLNFAPP